MIKASVSDTVTQYIMVARYPSRYQLNYIVSWLLSGLEPCFASVAESQSVIHAEDCRPRLILLASAMPPSRYNRGGPSKRGPDKDAGADTGSCVSGTTGVSGATRSQKKPRKAEIKENLEAAQISPAPDLPTWATFRKLAMAQSHNRLCAWGRHKLDEVLVVLTTFSHLVGR